ncbi:aminotransferase class III-fold pyridoxal phosphate-dependent enzyme [Nonomuraea sp. NPDC050202]|uniref:aminotransferase class III-fold pyridoxal phosphate-dependent enzyme n=1 Tax=Nonomuraea sp. NPDC050202 TaxID=3155035 RepID=UPI0033F098CD
MRDDVLTRDPGRPAAPGGRGPLAPGAQVWHNFALSAGRPAFFRSSKGARVFAEDGTGLLDLYGGSGTIILGHGNQAQIEAVRSVLGSGATVSLRHPLEPQLAARVVELCPEAEYAAFFKTGSEAVHAAITACIRATGRRKVLTTTYHGWLLPLGYLKPERRSAAERTSAREASGNASGVDVVDLDWQSPDLVEQVRQAARGAACVLITPNALTPAPEVVREVVRAARDAGALVVFDEVKAGFRYAYPNVTAVWDLVPDLRVLSKAMGNGFPIAALAGGELLASESTFSLFSTYASEFVSMAAATACLDELAGGGYDAFAAASSALYEGLSEIGPRYGVAVRGIATFFRLELPGTVHPDELCRALYDRGVLYHPLDEVLASAAWGPAEVEQALAAFSGALDETILG